jgi:hypothetical protein
MAGRRIEEYSIAPTPIPPARMPRVPFIILRAFGESPRPQPTRNFGGLGGGATAEGAWSGA